jgi:ribosomal protein L7/L12
MSDPTPESHADKLKATLLAGNKIQAIKIYREQTNVGLAEAKEAVEKLEAELRASSPESFAKPAGKGCFAALLILCAGAGAAALRWVL